VYEQLSVEDGIPRRRSASWRRLVRRRARFEDDCSDFDVVVRSEGESLPTVVELESVDERLSSRRR
jgi:hypothetical protein